MKDLLRKMFNGWMLHARSFADGQSERDMTACMVEACNGDVVEANMLMMFGCGHHKEDIVELAAHYGFQLTIDSDGMPIIKEDVPSAPSIYHIWSEGRWCERSELTEDITVHVIVLH